jgi:hypothetical protein
VNVPGVSRARPQGCLSDFALERILVGERMPPAEQAASAQHLSACAACRSRREELAAVEAQAPDPNFWRRAEGGAFARPAWSRRLVGGLAGAAALATVLLLSVRPHRADQASSIAADVRAKGDGLALEVVARRADGRLVPVYDGTALRPGDALRFLLNAPVAGQAAVLGLDGAGHVSVYAPAAPVGTLAVAAGPTTLPGSIVLDDAPGEERFVALLCEAQPTRAALDAAGRRALAAGGGVPGRVPRLDLPCRQDALTIRKESGR